MTHTTELKEVEVLKNGQCAVHIFCCGTHEFRHLLGPDVADAEASIKEGHDLAMKAHKGVQDLKAYLEALKGQTVTHE